MGEKQPRTEWEAGLYRVSWGWGFPGIDGISRPEFGVSSGIGGIPSSGIASSFLPYYPPHTPFITIDELSGLGKGIDVIIKLFPAERGHRGHEASLTFIIGPDRGHRPLVL